jgi:hypothetical protein
MENNMKNLLFLLLLCAGSLIAGETPKGTICFGTDCTPASESTFEVKPADVERRFVWMSNDASNIMLGTLAAKAVSVDLDPKDAATVTLSVRGNAQRGWPLETRFGIVESKDRQWRWSVPAKLIGEPMSIRVKPGTYTMLIGAEHHKGERRQLKVDAKGLALHEITLAPLSAVTGRVVTMKKTGDDKEPKETPVAGAQLARSDGKILGSTNEQGAFRVELIEPIAKEPIAKELVFIAPGLGNRVVPLNILAPDTDLDVISLSSGVKLTVHIARADSVKSKRLHVKLTEPSKTEYENTSIATRDLNAGDDDIVFPDLSAGEYFLTLVGDGVLEKLTTTIPIRTEDVSKEIRLSPFQLQGSVRLGSEPLHEGKVDIQDSKHTWGAGAPIDGDGRFGGAMWQAEGIIGFVNSKDTGALPVDGNPKLTGDPATWDIAFKRRLISGKIFDEETKAPIAHSELDLQLEARTQPGQPGPSRLYSVVHVDDDGRYSIGAPRDGVYDLSAKAPDHIAAKVTLELTDHDDSKTADLPLSRGIEQIIDFVWSNGEPVGQASVVEGIARDGYNAAWYGGTDATGRLRLRMHAGDRKTFFVVPKEGSFVPVHVVADETKPMRAVIPQPVASLVMKFQDTDKKPVPAGAAIRWNGEWLLPSVFPLLHTSRIDSGSLLFALLPAGSYEVWGVREPQEAVAPPAREPVRVGLSAGEQTIEITLPKKP